MDLYIQPKAARSEIVGIYNNRLKLRIQAPPVDGKANKEVLDFIATFCHRPKSSLEITQGLSGRNKRISILGITGQEFKILLSRVLD